MLVFQESHSCLPTVALLQRKSQAFAWRNKDFGSLKVPLLDFFRSKKRWKPSDFYIPKAEKPISRFYFTDFTQPDFVKISEGRICKVFLPMEVEDVHNFPTPLNLSGE